VHILDGDRQVVLAGSPGVIAQATPRPKSLCDRLVSAAEPPAVLVVPDVCEDSWFADNAWVTGELGTLRFYAAAPLFGLEGLPLGTLCVWSEDPRPSKAGHGAVLRRLADAVMATLDARRQLRELTLTTDDDTDDDIGDGLASAWAQAPVPAIRQLVDEGEIHTDFTPVVHLGTGSVVGFEASSRGPADSELATWAAMREAAIDAGCLGDLDWTCRVLAMEAAAASGLHPSLSWFINVEPAVLSTPCPEHLLPILAQARTELRVVFQVAEGEVEEHVTQLIRSADSARGAAWGVAVDDIGLREAPLALLPFLQPDVVKLDLAILNSLSMTAAAAIVAALRGYVERQGAVILVKGIVTEEDENIARTLGATYGQGGRYGGPGPLPRSVSVSRDVIPLRQRPQRLDGSTPFETLSAHRAPQRATRTMLARIPEYLEAQCETSQEPRVLLACFQDNRVFTAAQRERYDDLAAANVLTAVVGDDLPEHAEPGYRIAPLTPLSRMRREWAVILVSPTHASAFAARDCGDLGRDGARRFDYVYTHDRDLVVAAARSLLQELGPQTLAAEEPEESRAEVPEDPRPRRRALSWIRLSA
jgi:EAL domain-containing protein (putative c-di-GMP-specific phosphodiesterase class I)